MTSLRINLLDGLDRGALLGAVLAGFVPSGDFCGRCPGYWKRGRDYVCGRHGNQVLRVDRASSRFVRLAACLSSSRGRLARGR